VVDEHGLAERLLGLGAGVASVVAGLEATGVVGVRHDLVGLHPRQYTSYTIYCRTHYLVKRNGLVDEGVRGEVVGADDDGGDGEEGKG
jgi:hypothetical protein